ncbi:hypothetical protein Tco_1020543, partial [Tanacetum coccineum]
MSKVSVIIYITVAILILVLISHSPNKNSSNRQNRRHRRLKLRSNFTTTPTTADHHISFDPLIADIERKREDKQWEQTHYFNKDGDGDGDDVAPGMEAQPEWEDFIDAEDYLNDEHKF